MSNRTSPRIRPIGVTGSGEHQRKFFEFEVLDISTSGLAIYADMVLLPGAKAHIELEHLRIQLEIEVVNVQPSVRRHRIGCKIIQVSSGDYASFVHNLRSKQGSITVTGNNAVVEGEISFELWRDFLYAIKEPKAIDLSRVTKVSSVAVGLFLIAIERGSKLSNCNRAITTTLQACLICDKCQGCQLGHPLKKAA
jgi:hypothetical protein